MGGANHAANHRLARSCSHLAEMRHVQGGFSAEALVMMSRRHDVITRPTRVVLLRPPEGEEGGADAPDSPPVPRSVEEPEEALGSARLPQVFVFRQSSSSTFAHVESVR